MKLVKIAKIAQQKYQKYRTLVFLLEQFFKLLVKKRFYLSFRLISVYWWKRFENLIKYFLKIAISDILFLFNTMFGFKPEGLVLVINWLSCFSSGISKFMDRKSLFWKDFFKLLNHFRGPDFSAHIIFRSNDLLKRILCLKDLRRTFWLCWKFLLLPGFG